MNGFTAQPPHIEHIWIITGPAGCGKTTVAQYLAKELSLPYVEGDDVCSRSNMSKH
jgi:gluconokinase